MGWILASIFKFQSDFSETSSLLGIIVRVSVVQLYQSFSSPKCFY